MSAQQYMEPKPYFVLDASQVKELQREAGDLRKEVDDPQTSWLDRTRSAERLKTVEREIQTARMAHRQAEQQQQAWQAEVAAGHYIRNRNGDYLQVQNAEPSRQEFMPIATTSGGRGQPQWPESFSARHALVEAAVNELRQASIA